MVENIIFVVVEGMGSPSVYSKELSKRLKVETKRIREWTSFSEAFRFATYLLNTKNKIFHFPTQFFGKFIHFTRSAIITVHDLYDTAYFPDSHLNIKRRLYSLLDRKGIKKAVHIICPSNFTKQEVIRYLGIDSEKISVVYNGIDHDLFKPQKNESIELDYILFVGSEQPRKNLETLLKAFYKVKKDNRFRKLKLLKVGNPEKEKYRKKTLRIINELGLKKDVLFTGYVKFEELPIYYSNAKCFVLPSVCEGFGLTPIEAMACGCPVIVSGAGSLPEVVGDAGIIIKNPHDVDGFAEAIKELLTNDGLREDLIEKGFRRAKLFSWDKTAEEIKEIYKKLPEK